MFYCELSEIFLTVEGILEFDKLPEAQLWYWQKDQVKMHVSFKAETFLRDNQDVYMQLPERMLVDGLYVYFHKAIESAGEFSHIGWIVVRQIFAEAVSRGRFRNAYLRSFIGRERANRLIVRCTEIQKDSKRGLPASGFPVEAATNGR